MSLLDNLEIKEYELPETDLYHPNHPLHHTVLQEIEEYEKAMDEYWEEMNKLMPQDV